MNSGPKVFISYSHDNEKHKKWVLKLASDLRGHGVDVIFDQWDLRIGSDVRLFMEQGLSDTKLVICICTEPYTKKFDSGLGGAGYEGMIMTQPLLENAEMDFIIPIIRCNTDKVIVPRAFGSKNYIDFSKDSQYYEKYCQLLKRIYGEDTKIKPPLGKNPFSKDLGEKIDTKTKIESSIKYCSYEMDGMVKFDFSNNNGRYAIGSGEYLFSTEWSRAGNDSIYAYGYIGFKNGVSEFPSIEEVYEYDYSSNVRHMKKGEIVIFKNSNHHFAAVKVGTVKSKIHGNEQDEIEFEYHIYEHI